MTGWTHHLKHHVARGVFELFIVYGIISLVMDLWKLF